MKLLFQRKFIHSKCQDASFYLLLVSFHLHITYRKVRNLRIGVNKLVGKVLINLLCRAKFIIDVPAIVQLSKLNT